MNDLEIGQVLWLKIRFNNEGTISKVKHPYLIVDIDSEFGIVEIAQMDSLEGKEFKAAIIDQQILCTRLCQIKFTWFLHGVVSCFTFLTPTSSHSVNRLQNV